ncbi:hypothetical protein [Paenibacillus sp. P13VS]|uniref:hypothetical protein n=1 Tax=Paenibacillus sp. P13VS TaxID=2697367 RepID=UPI00187B15B2|nr:hypothetical protein [Paenibacillus sp. P13VS]MBE7682053.1 hypothetical protein [Paenibacillus sp. P13VS]
MESINWFAWVHLQSLVKFRQSRDLSSKSIAWLDKEIAELKQDLGIQESGQHANTSAVAAAY